MKSLKFLQLKNRNPGGRQSIRHSFAFFRSHDEENLSNIPQPSSHSSPLTSTNNNTATTNPKQDNHNRQSRDITSTLKTYLTKKKQRASHYRNTHTSEIRASVVEPSSIHDLKEEIQQREATLETLEKKIKGLESQKDKALTELEEAQKNLQDNGQEITNLENLLIERDQKTIKLTETLEKAKKEKNNLINELDKIKSELRVREKEISELNFSLLECAHELQTVKSDLTATTEERDLALLELEEQSADREKLIASHTNQLQQMKKELATIQHDLQNKQTELENVQSKFNEEIEAAQEMCTAEIEATKAKSMAELGVIKAKYSAELHAAKEEHADELESSMAQLSFFKSQLDSTKAQLSFTKSKLEWAKADLSSIKSLLNTAKADLIVSNNKLKITTAELEAAKSEIEAYVEMMGYRDGLTSFIIQIYQEDIKSEKDRIGSEIEEKQEQLSKIKSAHEKEKKSNSKTIKQLNNQVQNLTSSQVQEKARIDQLENENSKLKKQIERSKVQEEMSRLRSEVIALKLGEGQKEQDNFTPMLNEMANIKHIIAPFSPPESPCESNDFFPDLDIPTAHDAINGNAVNGSDEWVTVKKRGNSIVMCITSNWRGFDASNVIWLWRPIASSSSPFLKTPSRTKILDEIHLMVALLNS
ncbi:15875_t:CDS:2 [Entrophospora sp. SA101]|nr:15875_t:CDS:2 [Entrophospora sp. SA101]